MWDQLPITETPYNGTIEIWELYNTTPDTHPIHLHLVTFQILSRATFTGDPNDNPSLVPPLPLDPSERVGKIPFVPILGRLPVSLHGLGHLQESIRGTATSLNTKITR